MTVFLKLSWYFRLRWRRYSAAVAVLAVVAGLAMVPPWLAGRVVDAAAQQTLAATTLAGYVTATVGIALALYGLRYVWRVLLYAASFQLAARLRQDIYDHYTRMGPGFFLRHRTGDLMARATNDVNAVEMTAGEGVLTLVDGAMTGIVVLVILFFVISWPLTLLALLPWPLMAYAMWRFGDELQAAFSRAQARFSTLNDRTQEGIIAVRLVKAFGYEAAEADRFNATAREASDANLAVARADAKYDPTILLTIGLSFFLTVAGGAWLIAHQRMTVGELTSFTMYLGYLIWPMFAFGWLLNIVERGSAAYARIEELLNTPPVITDHGQRQTLASTQVACHVQCFAYPGEPAVLRDVHVSVEPGTTLGIVGPTGSGKTTLVSLLPRLYEGPGCRVELGGYRVQDYDLAMLRRAVAFVSQEPFLFSATVGENIALGRPQASRGQIREAARLACVDEDIEGFPGGYDTLVGERGVTLSGGQKQRLAIARALLLEAPVLVLDDALSAVDVGTERRILTHLRQVRDERTALVVSHRLSAVMDAEQILVLRDGQIAERGDHRQLVAQDGWYAHMFRYQQLEQMVEAGR